MKRVQSIDVVVVLFKGYYSQQFSRRNDKKCGRFLHLIYKK